MATSDSVVAFSGIDGSMTIAGAGSSQSITVTLVQTDAGWTEEGTPFVEARTRNQHQSTPVLRATGSGNCTGSINALVATVAGVTGASLYEVLTLKGLAASWTTTAAGDKKALRVVLTANASAAGGATQTMTMNYCVFSNVKVDPNGADGLWMISADFIDHENTITVA